MNCQLQMLQALPNKCDIIQLKECNITFLSSDHWHTLSDTVQTDQCTVSAYISMLLCPKQYKFSVWPKLLCGIHKKSAGKGFV